MISSLDITYFILLIFNLQTWKLCPQHNMALSNTETFGENQASVAHHTQNNGNKETDSGFVTWKELHMLVFFISCTHE